MAVRLYICGTRGSFPTFGKAYEGYGQATTCYVIREDDYAILLDCGTGLVNAVPVLAGCRRVDVVLSHVHYDHIMGLFIIPDPCPGAELTFYGNFDAWTAVSNKGKGGSHTFWPDTIKNHKQVSVKPGTEYAFGNGYKVEFTPSTHGDGALMTRIARNGRKLVFTGDYEDLPGSGIEEWSKGADWLIYDGSYAPEEYPGHEGWGHSTWKEACDLSLKCGVGKLLITHYANTHDDASLKEEEQRAREYTKNVTFAREGMCYPLVGDVGEQPSTFLYIESETEKEAPPVQTPVRVRSRIREEELKKIAYTGWLRRRSYFAAIGNWLIAVLSFVCLYDTAHRGGVGATASCPFFLLALIMLISVLLSIFDLNSVDAKEGSFLGRPHWASVALLFETSAAITLFLSSMLFFLPEKFAEMFRPGGWPGGIHSALVVPAMILVEFLFLEARAKISVFDMVIVFALLLGTHAAAAVAGPRAGLSGLLLEAFTASPRDLIYTAIYEGAAILVYFLNRGFMKDGAGYRKAQAAKPKPGKKLKRGFFSRERNCQLFYMVSNGLIALFSLRHVLTSLSMYQSGWISNPAVMSAFLVPVSLISVIFNIRAYRNNSTGIYPVWYKYLSYCRSAGTMLNFLTLIMVVVFSGSGFAGFTSVYCGGDLTVYLICPILAALMFFMESREYDLNMAIYTALTYMALFCITLLGLRLNESAAASEFDMATFYNGKMSYLTMVSEAIVVMLIYLADRIYIDNARFQAGEVCVQRDPEGKIQLLIAGARGGVAPTKTEYYQYGQASNCCCIRDGSYGMILDAGSGLIYAPEFLKGCTDVDVFLSDTRFSTVMGLLAAPNPCPGARIRIFGPFGRGMNFENMNGFATPPLWPVNVIVGECISATPDKDIRLNDRYSVRFQLVPRESGHYVLRISGAVGVCYTGPLDYMIKEEDEWAADCDLLLCDGRRGPEEAIQLGRRCGVSNIFVTNHRPFANDTQLAEEEKFGRASCADLTYARQGSVYTISN